MIRYVIFCSYCGWKLVTSDLKDIEIYELKNDTLSNKKYRCQNCGRACGSKKIPDPQKDLERKQKEEQISQETDNWIKQNIDFQVNFLKEEQDG